MSAPASLAPRIAGSPAGESTSSSGAADSTDGYGRDKMWLVQGKSTCD